MRLHKVFGSWSGMDRPCESRLHPYPSLPSLSLPLAYPLSICTLPIMFKASSTPTSEPSFCSPPFPGFGDRHGHGQPRCGTRAHLYVPRPPPIRSPPPLASPLCRWAGASAVFIFFVKWVSLPEEKSIVKRRGQHYQLPISKSKSSGGSRSPIGSD